MWEGWREAKGGFAELIVRYLYDGNDNTVAGISLIPTCSL